MSPSPSQRYRRDNDGEDPYTADLRVMFMIAVDELRPGAAQKLLDRVGPSFTKLAEFLDVAGEDSLWTLSSITDPNAPDPSHGSSAPAGASHVMHPPEFFSRSAEDLDPEESEEAAPSSRGRASGQEPEPPRPPSDLSQDQQREWNAFFRYLADENQRHQQECRELATSLRDELVAWAGAYNLHRDQWVLDHAVRVLQWYRLYPERWRDGVDPVLGLHVPWVSYPPPPLMPRWESGQPDRRPRRSEEETPAEFKAHLESYLNRVPKLPAYRPDQETEKDFRKRVDEYIQRVHSVIEEDGWSEGPWKPSAQHHLHWLAQFQVAEKRPTKIAGAGPDERTVERAIATMAQLIGLTRRTLM